MSNALHLPAAPAASAGRERSDALRDCVDLTLRRVVAASSIVSLELSSPLLLDGPVVAARPSHNGHQPSTLSIKVAPVPPTARVHGAMLLISASGPQALAEASAVPVLLSAVMDGELARLSAESTARGALEIANRDPATGLGNRRAWLQTLQLETGRTARSGRPLTVIIVDVDGLKAVNDTHGHLAGDEMIARTAAALDASRRATDRVCRIGGDEFGISAPDTGTLQAQQLVARIRGCLEESGVRASLGWAVGTGPHDIEGIWRQADAAMYEDKRSRR